MFDENIGENCSNPNVFPSNYSNPNVFPSNYSNPDVFLQTTQIPMFSLQTTQIPMFSLQTTQLPMFSRYPHGLQPPPTSFPTLSSHCYISPTSKSPLKPFHSKTNCVNFHPFFLSPDSSRHVSGVAFHESNRIKN
jgi:hypothetical protein